MIEQIREILKVDCIRREPECAGIRKDCLGCEWADNLTQSLLAALQPAEGELISRQRAQEVIPSNDCSGREYTTNEREDLVRYILLGAEMQLAHDKLTMGAQGWYSPQQVAELQQIYNTLMQEGAEMQEQIKKMVRLPSEAELVSIFSKAGIPPPYDFVAAKEFHRWLKEEQG